MNKSIFLKYISTFLLIIFISFFILTLIISSMTIRSENTQKITVADNTAAYITEYLVSEYTTFMIPTDFEQFLALKNNDISNMIDILSKNAEMMTIMITDPSGRIMISTGNHYKGQITDKVVRSLLVSESKSRVYSDLGGILERKYGVIVTPFQYRAGGTAGALIVCYSSGRLNDLTVSTIRTIVLASLWVMIASFVAVYFITEKIVLPIKQMNDATKKFAKGQFDVKIPIVGEDEIAELATAFNSMAEALANYEYTRSSFLANVSHDLRTPMTSISGFIDGILEGAIPPEKHPYYLEIIGQEVKRLSRLVTSLLDISRMEAGNRKFEKKPFDICEMARIILLSFEGKIDAKRLDVEFETSDDRLMVYSDKDAINQVLYNICDNAVKFSREGGKYRIAIIDEQAHIIVRVYNEGEGIPTEDLPHVFDRFYKSDKSRGLDKSGVGLGLYICKTIMDNLGETISVESEQGKYCEFMITLSKYKEDKSIFRRNPQNS